MRKWWIYVSNCGRRISQPEINFTKLFHVTLDLVSVYKKYKFQVNHLKNKQDLGHRKSRKMKSYFNDYWKLTNLFPVGLIFFWYYKRNLINRYRFNFKIKILKIRFLLLLPVTIGSEGRPAYPPKRYLLFKIHHLLKFQVSIYNRFREHSRTKYLF